MISWNQSLRGKHENLHILADIAKVQCVSTTQCERAFSIQDCIKTKTHKRLDALLLDHCCCFLYVTNCWSLLLEVDIITCYCCMLIYSLKVVEWCMFFVDIICYIGKSTYLSMPKFFAGCQYNEEEISWHLKKKYRILAGPNKWQQVCNHSNSGKTGRSWEGADFSWMSSQVSRTLFKNCPFNVVSWNTLSSYDQMI